MQNPSAPISSKPSTIAPLSPIFVGEDPTPANTVSVVVPFYNEAGNIIPLIEEIHDAMSGSAYKWEIIAVNDGSQDNTEQDLKESVNRFGKHVQVINFTRNFGQTAAMQAGIDAAQGQLIVTMDGDRQNDPNDIPGMINHLIENDFDMVCGWRKNRQDKNLERKLPSKIANKLIRKITGITVQDYGCSLKLFRAEIIKQVNLIGEMHRFIPAWVACVTSPTRIGELAVNHRTRQVGESKYGLSRTIRVILDLLAITFFMRFSRRPGHFFGSFGLLAGGAGALVLSYLLGLKIFLGADIGSRPLLFTGILLVMTGIQLLSTGVLSEMQTRSGPHQKYPVKSSTNLNTRVWHGNS